MKQTLIAGTELKLTVRVENEDIITVEWDKLPGKFLFTNGYAVLLRRGADETAGMVEMHRIAIDNAGVDVGHVEPLLSA